MKKSELKQIIREEVCLFYEANKIRRKPSRLAIDSKQEFLEGEAALQKAWLQLDRVAMSGDSDKSFGDVVKKVEAAYKALSNWKKDNK